MVVLPPPLRWAASRLNPRNVQLIHICKAVVHVFSCVYNVVLETCKTNIHKRHGPDRAELVPIQRRSTALYWEVPFKQCFPKTMLVEVLSPRPAMGGGAAFLISLHDW